MRHNNLIKLNVTNTTSLVSLDCNTNQLTSLNISGCVKLGVCSPKQSADLAGRIQSAPSLAIWIAAAID